MNIIGLASLSLLGFLATFVESPCRHWGPYVRDVGELPSKPGATRDQERHLFLYCKSSQLSFFSSLLAVLSGTTDEDSDGNGYFRAPQTRLPPRLSTGSQEMAAPALRSYPL